MHHLLAPVPLDRRLRRGAQLLAGLVLYGVTAGMLVLAGFGLDPWNVLHQGLSRTFGLSIGTGLYIGAGLGGGARDGLSTAIAARGHSMRTVRTSIEATVLATGFLLGGTVGIGTVLYALAIGPITRHTIPALAIDHRSSTPTPPPAARRPRDPCTPARTEHAADREPAVVLRRRTKPVDTLRFTVSVSTA